MLSLVMAALLPTLPAVHLALGLLLSLWTLAFLARVILSWYPKINLTRGFWPVVCRPTEPLLALTRQVVAPIGGVDATPVIWIGLLSLVRELLVGQQGILTQLLQLGIESA
ncbi:YggT family protein [cyanobiont of Ornithocercus magnificus]|nr:YggT family protein [cyanobiont of Ornithocercus magnificus]